MALEQFSAPIPPHLHEADALLTRFGLWAARRNSSRTCGSAEGQYRAPRRGDAPPPTADDRALPTADALRVHRVLLLVPDVHRVVLHVLYVPDRLPVSVRLRMLGIPPRVCRERHERGLLVFANLWRLAMQRESNA